MVPAPCRRDAAGHITEGDPVTVMVRVTDQLIHIMAPELTWERTDLPTVKATPFATLPLRSPASRVGELIILASSKRLSRYRWCPRCRTTHEPERMLESVCHGCAEKVLGVVF
ncbi:MAG TPA: hypothetical protein VJN18_11285 [Polyangiaceae bacterium]|nr:hypothetical protein [Polyangiaceae bacterium]